MKKQTIVVLGILAKDNKILLAKRPSTKKIAPGKYHIAGGHVEFGESPEAAIIREYKEEFCLDVMVVNTLKTSAYRQGETHTVGIVFEIKTPKGIPTEINYNSRETEAIAWVTKNEISHYLEVSDHYF